MEVVLGFGVFCFGGSLCGWGSASSQDEISGSDWNSLKKEGFVFEDGDFDGFGMDEISNEPRWTVKNSGEAKVFVATASGIFRNEIRRMPMKRRFRRVCRQWGVAVLVGMVRAWRMSPRCGGSKHVEDFSWLCQ